MKITSFRPLEKKNMLKYQVCFELLDQYKYLCKTVREAVTPFLEKRKTSIFLFSLCLSEIGALLGVRCPPTGIISGLSLKTSHKPLYQSLFLCVCVCNTRAFVL